MTNLGKNYRACYLAAFMVAVAGGISNAEDADRFRPYLRFHSGDIEPLWGTDDHWSFGLGANFNRYLGAELAFDYYLREWGEPKSFGEVSSYHLVPEIRLRAPMLKDRLVPYIVAGIGPSWLQSKDVKSWAEDLKPQVEGWTFTVAAGAGIEYFLTDNVTFGIEGKYLWVNSIDGSAGGKAEKVDLSTPLFTFGLRIYFDENHPKPLVIEEKEKTSRLYFGVRVGSEILTEGNLVDHVQLEPEQAAWGGVAGQSGGLLVGADFGKHFGAELTLDHVNNRVHLDNVGDITEYGQGWALASLRYRMPMRRWSPYVTLGGGICYAEVKDTNAKADGMHIEASGMSPALGVSGGVEYFILRGLSVDANVRWGYTWDHSFEIKGRLPPQSGDFSYFGVTIGFRVYLVDF